MTEEAQRIAIAKSLGWFIHHFAEDESGNLSLPLWSDGKKPDAFFTACPNYLHDLNACHEMEASLTESEWEGWMHFASMMHDQNDTEVTFSRFVAHLSATQRSYLFLQTKGLWQEDKQ